METQWFVKKKYVSEVIINKVTTDPILKEILSKQHFTSKEEIINYLNPNLEDVFGNTEKMNDLIKTAELLCNGSIKKIAITNDYDVDGIVSGFLLIKLMEKLQIDYEIYVPHRIHDGYGISKNTINKAIKDNCDTLISCDAGITAFDSIAYAKEKGLSVIITDHHDLSYDENKHVLLPDADLIINPKIEDYPFKYLCGAGVVYKLMIAVYNEKNWDTSELEELLPFVAWATIADIVELTDENRTIVSYGLPMLNETSNIGLNTLIKTAGLKENEDISTYVVGFILSPIINATGRLDSSKIALDLLLTNNEDDANTLALQAIELNKKRQELTNEALDRFKKSVEKNYKDDKILVLYDEDIHESIAGIIAGRIKDEFHKPTIVLTNSLTEGLAKGSARSIEEYNIRENLALVQDTLEGFGGHSMAAGLSIKTDNIEALRNKLNSTCTLTENELTPKIKIDAILSLANINLKLAENLVYLEPFGCDNYEPLFGSKNLKLEKVAPLGKNNQHFKLSCIENNKKQEFLLFFKADKFLEDLKEKYNDQSINNCFKGIGDISIDLIYSISINEFRGVRSAQTIIKDYRFPYK